MTYSAKDIQKFCSIVRGDGVYTEVGGDENALIQKLVINKKAFGLISYSFLSRNANKVMAHMINRQIVKTLEIRLKNGFLIHL